jgi:hypothetical protein
MGDEGDPRSEHGEKRETTPCHLRDKLRLDILDLLLELVQREDDRERAPVGFCDFVLGGVLARLKQLDHLHAVSGACPMAHKARTGTFESHDSRPWTTPA